MGGMGLLCEKMDYFKNTWAVGREGRTAAWRRPGVQSDVQTRLPSIAEW